MNYIFKNITIALLMLVSFFGLVACNGKTTLQNIVKKTYSVTTQIERYVTGIDSTNLATKIKSLENPIKIAANSINFIANKVSDEKYKSSLLNVAKTLENIVSLINSSDLSKIEVVRGEILSALSKTKDSLVLIAIYLDVDLSTIKSDASMSLEDIELMSLELDNLIKSSN